MKGFFFFFFCKFVDRGALPFRSGVASRMHGHHRDGRILLSRACQGFHRADTKDERDASDTQFFPKHLDLAVLSYIQIDEEIVSRTPRAWHMHKLFVNLSLPRRSHSTPFSLLPDFLLCPSSNHRAMISSRGASKWRWTHTRRWGPNGGDAFYTALV